MMVLVFCQCLISTVSLSCQYLSSPHYPVNNLSVYRQYPVNIQLIFCQYQINNTGIISRQYPNNYGYAVNILSTLCQHSRHPGSILLTFPSMICRYFVNALSINNHQPIIVPSKSHQYSAGILPISNRHAIYFLSIRYKYPLFFRSFFSLFGQYSSNIPSIPCQRLVSILSMTYQYYLSISVNIMPLFCHHHVDILSISHKCSVDMLTVLC